MGRAASGCPSFPSLEVGMPKVFRLIYRHIEEWSGALFIITVFLSVTVQIVTRLLGDPVSWGEEVARYAYVWYVFLGAAFATMQRQHIRLVFLINRLSERNLKIVDLIITIVCMISVLVILPGAFDNAVDLAGGRSAALEISMFYVWISFPIAMILLLLRGTVLIVEDIQCLKSHRSEK